MFRAPDQRLLCWTMPKNPTPLGLAQVRLHKTAEMPDGSFGEAPNVPIPVRLRCWLPPNAPPLTRESRTRAGGLTGTGLVPEVRLVHVPGEPATTHCHKMPE